jgi:hypothetical protein
MYFWNEIEKDLIIIDITLKHMRTVKGCTKKIEPDALIK